VTKLIVDSERISRLEADPWYKVWYFAVSFTVEALLRGLAEIRNRLL
jgi:uncharacterized membrane protein (DUF106 family)